MSIRTTWDAMTCTTIRRYCTKCEGAGVPYEVIIVPGEPTGPDHVYGPGLPTKKYRCVRCGDESGPWIRIPYEI
jgi:hypothetical protein